jgi:hypothetical protein
MSVPTKSGIGAWLGFNLAVELVERNRGVSWGQATKAIDDACDSGMLRYQPGEAGPDIWDQDFWRSPNPPSPETGKQPLIIKYLAEMYPLGVPAPAHCPRKDLLNKLIKRDPNLASLGHKTLKRAIDKYNSSNGKR